MPAAKQHKFQRIDKGQKRNRYAVTRTRKSGAKGEIVDGVPAVTEEQHEVVAAALQRYVRGESIQTISKEYGIDRGTLYNWMLGDLGPTQYANLVTQVLVSRVRKADEALEGADDPLNIARAREMARFARMDLERRRPHLYGPRTHVTVEQSDYAAEIRAAREARMKTLDVVDAEVVHTQQTLPDNSVTDGEQS